jgi:hypothetical protein
MSLPRLSNAGTWRGRTGVGLPVDVVRDGAWTHIRFQTPRIDDDDAIALNPSYARELGEALIEAADQADDLCGSTADGGVGAPPRRIRADVDTCPNCGRATRSLVWGRCPRCTPENSA